eukprot:101299_1
MALVFTASLLSSMMLIHISYSKQPTIININTDKTIATTSDYFVSYTLDTANFFQLTPLNLSSLQFQYMAKQLSPAIIRIGGTEADYTYYFTDINTGQCEENIPTEYNCFSRQHLEMLINFVTNTNAKLIFSLSLGYPTYPTSSTTQWNSTNTEIFLNYIINHGYADKFYGFSLGNEMNEHGIQPSFQINAFKKLRQILYDLYSSINLQVPIIAGPDPHSYTLRRNESYQWIEGFLKNGCYLIDAFTYHTYVDVPVNNLFTLDGINEQYKESSRFGRSVKKLCPDTQQLIFASEMAEYNNGGNDGVTNKYMGSLWYLDALGSIAALGQNGVFRQQIWGKEYHPNYALLNSIEDNEYVPLPDYWIAVLFNKLMGVNVFNITSTDAYLRTYVHSFKGNDGTIVMAFVNIQNKSVLMEFSNDNLGVTHMDYIITSKDNILNTTSVFLNGELLALNGENQMPLLNGVKSDDVSILIEPYSIGFIHFIEYVDSNGGHHINAALILGVVSGIFIALVIGATFWLIFMQKRHTNTNKEPMLLEAVLDNARDNENEINSDDQNEN